MFKRVIINRPVLFVISTSLVLTAGGAVILVSGKPNFLFKSLLRMPLGSIPGWKAEFEEVEGSVFGTMVFKGLHLEKQINKAVPGDDLVCDVTIDELEVCLGGIESGIFDRNVIERLESADQAKEVVLNKIGVKGMRGQVSMIKAGTAPTKPAEKSTPLNLCIKELSLRDCSLSYDKWMDEGRIEVPVSVEYLDIAPYRFEKALPSFLLRAKGKGEIGHKLFVMEPGKELLVEAPAELFKSRLGIPVYGGSAIINFKSRLKGEEEVAGKMEQRWLTTVHFMFRRDAIVKPGQKPPLNGKNDLSVSTEMSFTTADSDSAFVSTLSNRLTSSIMMKAGMSLANSIFSDKQ